MREKHTFALVDKGAFFVGGKLGKMFEFYVKEKGEKFSRPKIFCKEFSICLT